MKSIEQNVKEICRRKGLTLTDVANRTGNSPSNLLSSIKGNPKLSTLQEVADALQVSISEIVTMRPESSQGLVIIEGQTYQLSKPSASAVQIPTFGRYDVLRGELRIFIANAVEASETTSKMGLLETMEYFSLVHDAAQQRFLLSLCYADGKTTTMVYDKFEFCDWSKSKSENDAPWDLQAVTEEIINDIEGRVPQLLQSN
ncbi:MAG: helix-turn-helix transcriptional regulator [Prevotella sp.]|nr:helix-turn-helix transcriptional regulator [Prevotella sp.]